MELNKKGAIKRLTMERDNMRSSSCDSFQQFVYSMVRFRIQRPFQPSSSRAIKSVYKCSNDYYYLVWNHIGIVNSSYVNSKKQIMISFHYYDNEYKHYDMDSNPQLKQCKSQQPPVTTLPSNTQVIHDSLIFGNKSDYLNDSFGVKIREPYTGEILDFEQRFLFLDNNPNYTLGALTKSQIALAANSQGSPDGKTVLAVFNRNERVNRIMSKWVFELDSEVDDEQIDCLTICSSAIVLISDKRLMRVFSFKGDQIHLISLSGQIVCSVGYDNRLLIISQNGVSMIEDLNLSLLVYNLDENCDLKLTTSINNIPLSKDSYLYWAGFTIEGTPCIYDSMGVIRLLDNSIGQTWSPMFVFKNLLRSSANVNFHYFLICLSESGRTLKAVECRNSCYPTPGALATEYAW